MTNTFLAMWDCEGLECLFDITNTEHDAMIAGLKNEPFKMPFNIGTLMLRARYNSQRSYEIYSFSTDTDVSYDDVKEMFDSDPQGIVDLVRRKGRKIYSDYSPSNKKVIV
jgi:hypothetical protein